QPRTQRPVRRVARMRVQRVRHDHRRHPARLRRRAADARVLIRPTGKPIGGLSMRALCGAIIAAGALIGLGLTALGIGTRYASLPTPPRPEGGPAFILISQMDGSLAFALVFLTCAAVIGLGIAFLGLSYHHARREREHQWERERAAGQ